METWNKYKFIEELRNAIESEIKNGNITDEEEIYNFIWQEIDNACIYYLDCFEICKELNFTDFTGHELGEINTINQASFCALYDWIYLESDFDIEHFNTLLEEINN